MTDPVALFDAGSLSAEMTVARLVLAGVTGDTLRARVRERAALAALADKSGLDAVASVAAVLGHAQTSVADIAARFDSAVRRAPVASVAVVSLDDPAILARATSEIVAWLWAEGLADAATRVLDLGCGIGRVAAALAGRVRHVHGVDVSAAMLAEARGRVPDDVALSLTDGRSVPPGPWDLVLAVDSFPYAVLAGVAAPLARAVAHALAPDGRFVALNLAYGRDESHIAHSLGAGLRILTAGTRPFTLWDASAWVFGR